jgi:sulfur carrier protein
VKIQINGESHELPGGSTAADAVRLVFPGDGGVAVALNDDVVPRSRWALTELAEGDRVEVLTAVQGG